MADALGKLLESLLLPPGLVVALLVVALVLQLRGARRAWVPLAAALGLLAALSSPLVSGAMARALERTHPPLRRGAEPGTIVVLAGGALGGSPEEPGSVTLSVTSLRRVTYARDLYRRSPAPIVVCGGARADGRYATEAGLMKQRLVRLGVPEERVFAEDDSVNTRENARGYARLAKREGLSRPALVTSAMHMPRAVTAFEGAGVEVTPAPTDYRAGGGRLSWRSLLPSSEALGLGMAALHEVFGSVYYRIAYR